MKISTSLYASQLMREEMENHSPTVMLDLATKLHSLPLLFLERIASPLLNQVQPADGECFWYCFREGWLAAVPVPTAGQKLPATSAG